MKKLSYLCLLLMLSLFACQKAEIDLMFDTIKNGHSDKISICHNAGKGKINVIQINKNALASHLAHGDNVPDADGDGYSAVGACTGTMDDCNDNDAAINPGAEEICGDGKDNNCNGTIDEDCGPDFTVFNIRNNNTIPIANRISAPWDSDIILSENAAGDGFSFGTPQSGQKVGYGTKFFDGMKLNTIKSVNWNWNIIAGNGGIIPYLNIWVTDGAGNYAVISSENNYRGSDFGTRAEWKIFEYGTSTSNFKGFSIVEPEPGIMLNI